MLTLRSTKYSCERLIKIACTVSYYSLSSGLFLSFHTSEVSMQQANIGRSYTFEAAHFLPGVPDGHKCKRLHGHNYRIVVSLSGHVDIETGFVIDFFDLDTIVAPLIAKLDHRTLNDIEGLHNPSAEFIAHWFADRLDAKLLRPAGIAYRLGIRVYETDNAYAEVFRTS